MRIVLRLLRPGGMQSSLGVYPDNKIPLDASPRGLSNHGIITTLRHRRGQRMRRLMAMVARRRFDTVAPLHQFTLDAIDVA